MSRGLSGQSLLAGLGITAILLWITVAVGTVVGYIINIIHLVHMDHVFNTGLGWVRAVGIVVPPLGAFMGIFDRFF